MKALLLFSFVLFAVGSPVWASECVAVVNPRPQLNLSEELGDLLLRDDFKGEEVMNFLSEDKKLRELFAADAGIWEGYSIREHTQMVYDIFQEQLPHFRIESAKTPSQIDTIRLFRFLISIHDIGKPIAIKNEGKHAQHKYTTPIVVSVMEQNGFSEEEIHLAKSIVNNDILGDVMKGNVFSGDALSRLQELASSNSMSISDYFLLQSFFYIIDAASYPTLRRRIFRESEDGQLIPNSNNFHELSTFVKENG